MLLQVAKSSSFLFKMTYMKYLVHILFIVFKCIPRFSLLFVNSGHILVLSYFNLPFPKIGKAKLPVYWSVIQSTIVLRELILCIVPILNQRTFLNTYLIT